MCATRPQYTVVQCVLLYCFFSKHILFIYKHVQSFVSSDTCITNCKKIYKIILCNIMYFFILFIFFIKSFVACNNLAVPFPIYPYLCSCAIFHVMFQPIWLGEDAQLPQDPYLHSIIPIHEKRRILLSGLCLPQKEDKQGISFQPLISPWHF